MWQIIKDIWRTWKQIYYSYSIFLKKSSNEDRTEKEIHDTYYSHLLFDYTQNVKKTLKQKRRLKRLFFVSVMLIFIAAFILFYKSSSDVLDIIHNANTSDKNWRAAMATTCEAAVVIVPSLVSLVVAFLKIPEIITKYLFDTDEDKYMSSIIQNLQVYDRDIFQIEQKIHEAAKAESVNVDNDKKENWISEPLNVGDKNKTV